MGNKVFVDGQEGTTGLKIFDYISKIPQLEILTIDSDKRKDPAARSRLLNEADIVFLCLPDAAAKESVELVTNTKTKIINTSSVFRTDASWVFGLPELKNQRDVIRTAARLSVPGCHATGFILSVRPLVDAGVLPTDYPVSCYSVTGYSGGGRSKIRMYEDAGTVAARKLDVPRHYALQQNHKHLAEMKMYAGLAYEPIFTPIIANYAQGQAMSIPLTSRYLHKNATAQHVHELLSAYYDSEPFVRVMPYDSEFFLDDGYFPITACNNTNKLEIFVFGREDRFQIVSRYDNLGKGASGAAIQNLNLMLGFDERNCLE